jgi:type I site-specific restriction endonuclease
VGFWDWSSGPSFGVANQARPWLIVPENDQWPQYLWPLARLVKSAETVSNKTCWGVRDAALLVSKSAIISSCGRKTIGFFNQNLVMQYGHDEAVTDGVNVDFDVYRIRTRITEQGATIAAGDTGVYVDKRHKLTRRERLEFLNQDLTYTSNQLDRDVVSESQIRTVLQQFRDKVLPDAFPGRNEVPKTLIFAKDDSHADDIVRIAREVFAAGNEFCQKITYRTGFTNEYFEKWELLATIGR